MMRWLHPWAGEFARKVDGQAGLASILHLVLRVVHDVISKRHGLPSSSSRARRHQDSLSRGRHGLRCIVLPRETSRISSTLRSRYLWSCRSCSGCWSVSFSFVRGMATRVQWCLLWSTEDGMFECAHCKHRRWRLRSIYQYARVLIYRDCQSAANATISMFRCRCLFTCAIRLLRAGKPM